MAPTKGGRGFLCVIPRGGSGVREESTRALCEELGDPTAGEARRILVAWVLGHAREARVRRVLFEVADDPDASGKLRRVAAYAWWRLGLAADPVESQQAAAEWPEDVLTPTLTALPDETMEKPHHAWTRTVLQCRPRFSVAALMLGDYPEDPVGWAFLNAEELTTLRVPDPAPLDVDRLLALGEDWAAHPPSTFFGQQALRDAYRWAEAALQMRVAERRYSQLREWEAWLRDVLQKPAEPTPPPPVAVPISLAHPRPQAEATTLLILGAFREAGFEPDPVGMSSRLSAAAAGLHVSLSQVYENAHRTAWHVAGMTGELEIRLLSPGGFGGPGF